MIETPAIHNWIVGVFYSQVVKPFDSVMGICGLEILSSHWKNRIMKISVPIDLILKSLKAASGKGIPFSVWIPTMPNSIFHLSGNIYSADEVANGLENMLEYISDKPALKSVVQELGKKMVGFPKMEKSKFIGGKCVGSETIRQKKYLPAPGPFSPFAGVEATHKSETRRRR